MNVRAGLLGGFKRLFGLGCRLCSLARGLNCRRKLVSCRLEGRLRRAARRDDLAGLPLPPWEQLRADAAAKRALWVRLRALRRTR